MKKFNYDYVEKGSLLKVKAISPGDSPTYSYPIGGYYFGEVTEKDNSFIYIKRFGSNTLPIPISKESIIGDVVTGQTLPGATNPLRVQLFVCDYKDYPLKYKLKLFFLTLKEVIENLI